MSLKSVLMAPGRVTFTGVEMSSIGWRSLKADRVGFLRHLENAGFTGSPGVVGDGFTVVPPGPPSN